MAEQFLNRVVQVSKSYLRAVRLEDDLFEGHLLEGYILTAQVLTTLERIVEGLTNHSKAWTLTGPYGSGKSHFALFLSHLLDKRSVGHSVAWEMVERVAPSLAERLQLVIGTGRGLRTIPVTGARAPFQECLSRAFLQVIEKDNFPSDLKNGLKSAQYSDSRTFLKWIQKFLETLSELESSKGVLIVFDEMGKALEYAALRPHESDVYLLQELAEFASRSDRYPVVLIGILHQSFEGYAALLDRTTQREWEKVQGRFEDIPFQEPPVQQMYLLSSAFRPLDNLPKSFRVAHEWRPATMNAEDFEYLSRRAYPLHSSVLSVLPYIFRRLAQNERSIFTYLLSHEPFGFQEFLTTHTFGETLCLPDVFDYLVANYPSRIYASRQARPIAETLSWLENTPFLNKVEQDLLKTIGLLNWLGEISPFQAKENLIISALLPNHDESAIRAALESLQQRSLIVYRRFNQNYTVWQGSDIDLEERLHAGRAAVETTFSVAEALQSYLPPRPLLAHRHSYKTGSLRFFEVRYVDYQNQSTISLTPVTGASGIVLLCLPTTLNELEQFENWAQSKDVSSSPNLVIGISGRALHLKELVQELRALHWVYENTPALYGDSVARREWRTRLSLVEQAIRLELAKSFNLQQISALKGCKWFHAGQDVSSKVQRGLSVLLSEICDLLYPASPRLWNELLNRRELTPQGAAARRVLIEGILTRAEKPLLGIQKFPPERSMYEALLRRGGLHRQEGENWFLTPPVEEDPLNLRPAWNAIAEFVFDGLPEPRPLLDLYARLFAPPYGVMPGLAPVLLAIFYKVHENEMTLYKDGTLLVEPGIADWEVLLRRPELFSLAGCRVTGLRAAIVERLARGLHTPPYVMPVVRSLIGRLKALPEYAWRTRKLPEVALNLRRVVEISRSPERFLFVELPTALDLPPFDEGEFDAARLDVFFERLNQALDALANATPRLLAWARDTWLMACGLPPGESSWEKFRQQSTHLVQRVTNPNLLPLLKRTVEIDNSQAALEGVLAFIASRPLRAWNDTDAERFKAQAAYLGNLWRLECGETELSSSLLPEQRIRALALADQLEAFLHESGETSEVLRAAVEFLLGRLKH